MTKFDRTKFQYHGGYLSYEGRFVARFKYGAKRAKPKFLSFLIKNFSVEEYFAALGASNQATPCGILEAKGWSQLAAMYSYADLARQAAHYMTARGEVPAFITRAMAVAL